MFDRYDLIAIIAELHWELWLHFDYDHRGFVSRILSFLDKLGIFIRDGSV